MNTRNAPAEVWGVSGLSTADGGLIHFWAYGGGANQQWQAVQESGGTNSVTLMQVGPAGSATSHAANPDFAARRLLPRRRCRGRQGHAESRGEQCQRDHGSGVGWNSNTADTGLVFNGDNVTMYGLFVEHYQKYQTIWNGNGGRTYLYQNEMPYDPPNQAAWMNGSTQGYAACKVGNSVTGHEAWGLGSYCFFSADNSVVAARAFEVPNTAPGQPACAVVAAAVTHAGSFCRRSGEPGSRTGVLCGNLVTAGVTLVVVKP